MIYKKSRFKKLFRTIDTCSYQDCGHIFQDGDSIYIDNSAIFGDHTLCYTCYIKWEKECMNLVAESRQRELDRKRADYKILAEEIVKILLEK